MVEKNVGNSVAFAGRLKFNVPQNSPALKNEMPKVVGVLINGVPTWHAAGVVNDYATLCGMDSDDPAIGHQGLVAPTRGQKIECRICKSIWTNTMALKLRVSDFS